MLVSCAVDARAWKGSDRPVEGACEHEEVVAVELLEAGVEFPVVD